MTIDDSTLLLAYVRDRSEEAFSDLVRRHINLVYSAALREANGNAPIAEDITQAVFVELAKKSPSLTRHPALAGWLYTSVRHMAANLRRAEQRRQRREQESLNMNEILASGADNAAWEQLRPVIDDAMHELSDRDRTAVVLRYFEQRSLAEVGTALGVNENAARARVDRALDRLRGILAKRGISSTASGLAATLVFGAVSNAPSALASTVAAAAMAGAGTAAASASLPLFQLTIMSKAKIAAISSLVIAGVAIPVWQQNRIEQFAAENRELRAHAEQVAPLQQEIDRLKQIEVDRAELEQLRGLKSEVLQLRAKLNAAQMPRISTPSGNAFADMHKTSGAEAADTNQVAGAMGEMIKKTLEQQISGRVSRMKQKLNLTPDQAATVETILRGQIEQSTTLAQKMFSGKLSREELAEANRNPVNQEAEIKALLSPDQLAAYEEFKNEEAVSNARLAANAEMLQLQQTVGLSQEQQDKVYKVLYEQLYQQASGGFAAQNPQASIQEQFTKKFQALESILTPEQLETYRKIQESQLQFINSMSPFKNAAPQ